MCIKAFCVSCEIRDECILKRYSRSLSYHLAAAAATNMFIRKDEKDRMYVFLPKTANLFLLKINAMYFSGRKTDE